MPRPRVYVETTIPSFYFETRASPEVVEWRVQTREWWADAQGKYDLVTSSIVMRELLSGPAERWDRWLGLIRKLPLLPVDPGVEEIVQAYLRHKLMPVNPNWDAFHLALASYHRCDFLVTWNCRHLANANKYGHIRRINSALGLFVPTLATPYQMLGGTNARTV